MTAPEIQAALQESRQHLGAGAPDLAIQRLQEILEHDPCQVQSLKLLGVACAMKGENGRAVESLEAALALDGSDAQSRYNLALLYEKEERFPQAFASLEEALRLRPDYAIARQALDRIRPHAEEQAEHEAAEVRRRLSREAAERAPYLTVDDPAPLIWTALQHDDPGVRRCAVRVFSQLPRERALRCYETALKDEDDLVRRAAVKALARGSGADAVPLLLQALGDRDFSVRSSAAKGLASLSRRDSAAGAEAIPALQGLLSDENGDLQYAAMQALVRVGDAGAFTHLRRMLQENRVSSDDAAGLLNDSGVADLADRISGWASDPHEGVRKAAAIVGETTDDHGSAAQEDADSLIERLTSAPTPHEREIAAAALGKIGAHEAVFPLIEALRDRGSSVRVEAARSLAAIGDPTAVDGLRAMLADSYMGARAAAVESLSVLGWRPSLLSEWVSTTFTDLSEGEKRTLLKEFAMQVLASDGQHA